MRKWRWLTRKPKDRTISGLKQELATVVEQIFGIDPIADLTIRQIIFDTKYKSDLAVDEEYSPSELVTRFTVKADKGDNTFLRHYFYRVLRRNADPVIRRLKYRLKRNI